MPTYSHSKLSTYENCPQQYKLKYIDYKTSGWLPAQDQIDRDCQLLGLYHKGITKKFSDVRSTFFIE